MDPTTILTAVLAGNAAVGLAAMRIARQNDRHNATLARARRQRTAGHLARHRATRHHDTPIRTAARTGHPFPLEQINAKHDRIALGSAALHHLRLTAAARNAWDRAESTRHPGFTNAEARLFHGTGTTEPAGILAFRCDELPTIAELTRSRRILADAGRHLHPLHGSSN